MIFAGWFSHTSATAILAKRLPSISQYDYIGCYADPTAGVQVLPRNAALSPQMTLEKCAEVCRYNVYFGVRNGDACYCGDVLRTDPPSVMEGSDETCDIPCQGNSAQKCGASSSLSLWKKKQDAVIPLPTTLTYNPVGCYSIPAGGFAPDLSVVSGTVGTWLLGQPTHERCEDVCRGSNFFILYGIRCTCGDELTSSTKLKEASECDYPCQANSPQMCGGILNNARVNVFANIVACGTLNIPRRVQNPGFENGETAWIPSRGGSGTVKWTVRTDTSIAFTGSRFSRFDFFAGSTGRFALTQQGIPVCTGTAYMLSLHAKKSNDAADCAVQTYLDGQRVASSSVNTNWLQISGFIVPYRESAIVEIEVTCDSVQTGYLRKVFVDNVVLRPATPQEVTDNANL